MSTFIDDLRQAVRILRRNPGFAAAIVLTLAIGIGGTTAIFSVVDQILLRPFAFDADRVVEFWFDIPERNLTDWGHSNETYAFLRESLRTVSDLSAFTPGYRIIGLPEENRRVASARVSASFFDVIRLPPIAGRYFTDAEDSAGGPAVAVVSEGIWRRELGADPGIVGTTLQLDGEPFTIVGVAPEELRVVERSLQARGPVVAEMLEIYTPTGPFLSNQPPNTYGFKVLGRLEPSTSLAAARGELASLTDALLEAASSTILVPSVDSFRKRVTGGSRSILLVLAGAAAAVLGMVCANVSALLLVRSSRRDREWAVRRAIGGTSGRIARQLAIEGSVVAAAGGALGVVTARWLLTLLRASASTTLPRLDGLIPDLRVFAVSTMVTLVAALAFGLLPAAVFARRPAAATMGTRGGHLTSRGRRGLQTLVGVEVALAVALTIGALTLTQSLDNLLAQDPGYDPEGVLSMNVELPGETYPGDAEIDRYTRAVIEELAGVPGVEKAAIMSGLPMMLAPWNAMTTKGPEGPVRVTARETSVTPMLFDALGMNILEGRGFSVADGAAAAPVVVVSTALAELVWPGESPVGKWLTLGSWRQFNRAATKTTSVDREVVGVVNDFRTLGMAGGDAVPHVFMPYAQAPWSRPVFVLRTAGDPASLAPTVRSAIRGIDPALPIWGVETLTDNVARSNERERFGTEIVSGFAIVSFLLAMTGIYGVVSYTVVLRTRELGLRAALGARPAGLVGFVLRSGLAPVAIGIVAGLGAALAGREAMGSVLYQVNSSDPVILALTASAVALVALFATYLPVRRVARLDPVLALRAR